MYHQQKISNFYQQICINNYVYHNLNNNNFTYLLNINKTYNLRQPIDIYSKIIFIHSNYGIYIHGVKHWNILNNMIKNNKPYKTFNTKLKLYIKNKQ